MLLNAQCLAKPIAAPTLYAELSNNNIDTVIPRIIAGGDDYFLSTKRSQLFEGAIISNIGHWRSCPKYFVLLFHSNRKLITSNKLGFLIVPNLVIWLIFNVNILGVRAWISFAWSGSTATWKGGDKKREDGERVGVGDYSREAIYGGTAIIRGLFCGRHGWVWQSCHIWIAQRAMSWWAKIELPRWSVVVLLWFEGIIGKVKRWMSLIAWYLSP